MRFSFNDAVAATLCLLLLAGLLVSCQSYKPLPYRPKSAVAPEPQACHDAIGHVEGNRPFVLGGTCCCTPDEDNYRLHVQQGTMEPDMDYAAYTAAVKQKNIVTDLDHTGCGNLCEYGPHVLLGGRCMATPTPGTPMYEQVTYGPHENLLRPVARADADD